MDDMLQHTNENELSSLPLPESVRRQTDDDWRGLKCLDLGYLYVDGHLNKEEEARALVRELFISAGDIEPDEDSKTLTVRIHRMVTPAHDKAIAALLKDLNNLDFCHPETGQNALFTGVMCHRDFRADQDV